MEKHSLTINQIKIFLKSVDNDFPVSLSCKQNLDDLACKFYEKATICAKIQDGKILSAVIGYTENLKDNMSYISVVATLKTERGKGYASSLLEEFIHFCREKGIDAIHLYTNEKVEELYRKKGFAPYKIRNETRPYDIHLILML
ncbi:MAG: GNAT family N-acetyltransferase [Candidatus Scatosoma sp.]